MNPRKPNLFGLWYVTIVCLPFGFIYKAGQIWLQAIHELESYYASRNRETK